MVYLGILPKAFKSMEQQIYNELSLKLSEDKDKDDAFSLIEENIIEHAIRAANLYYHSNDAHREVILVAGVLLDFTEECEKYNFELTKIDTTEGFLSNLQHWAEGNGYTDEYL